MRGSIPMKTFIRRALFAALAISAMALISCAEGPTGIFASVAAETPVNKTMTPAIQYASPTFVARLGSTWYSGMGVLWQKADGATQWSKANVSLPGVSASDTLYADSGAVAGGKLYVAFSDVTTRTSLGVWAYDGASWTKVTFAGALPFPGTGKYLRKIMVSNNGQLFAVTADERADSTVAEKYSIYTLSGTTFDTTAWIYDDTIDIPTSVASDGTNYWFAAGDSLLYGTGATLSKITDTGRAYSGLCYDGTNIIVSSRNGYLYRFTGATPALQDTAGPFKNSLGKIYSFSAPTYIAAAPGPILVVGTNRIPRSNSDIPPAGGYLEFDATNFATTFAASTPTTDHHLTASAVNFDTSLDSRSVSGMPYFAAEKKLFAMTDGYGLWSDTYSGTPDHANGWDWWIRE